MLTRARGLWPEPPTCSRAAPGSRARSRAARAFANRTAEKSRQIRMSLWGYVFRQLSHADGLAGSTGIVRSRQK
eukprot:7033771-Prymnesium_polylepis.1